MHLKKKNNKPTFDSPFSENYLVIGIKWFIEICISIISVCLREEKKIYIWEISIEKYAKWARRRRRRSEKFRWIEKRRWERNEIKRIERKRKIFTLTKWERKKNTREEEIPNGKPKPESRNQLTSHFSVFIRCMYLLYPLHIQEPSLSVSYRFQNE